VAAEQLGPFGLRLLDPAFAEIALAGGDEGFDLVDRPALADRDQLDGLRLTPGKPGCRGDAVEDGLSAVGGRNQNLKAVPT
jgi:hypothetical protein